MSTVNNTGRENKNNKQCEDSKELHPPKSGANYFAKVDGKVIASDVAILKASDVLALAGLNPQTHQLVRLFDNDCKEVLSDDAVVDLSKYGIEEFRTEKRLVEIFYKDQSFKVHPGEILVADLKRFLGLPQACHLSVRINDELKPVKDDGVICIQGGEHFVSYPCDGKAS